MMRKFVGRFTVPFVPAGHMVHQYHRGEWAWPKRPCEISIDHVAIRTAHRNRFCQNPFIHVSLIHNMLLSAWMWAFCSCHLLKNTFLLDCNTPGIPCRNASLNNLPHAMPGGGTAIWLRRYRPKVSNLGISGIAPARSAQMPHKWDCG